VGNLRGGARRAGDHAHQGVIGPDCAGRLSDTILDARFGFSSREAMLDARARSAHPSSDRVRFSDRNERRGQHSASEGSGSRQRQKTATAASVRFSVGDKRHRMATGCFPFLNDPEVTTPASPTLPTVPAAEHCRC
jgi:hypothetical protein